MDAKTALHVIKQQLPNARLTVADAQWFLDICAERGLTPFQEAYFCQIKGKNFVKEHYGVQARWAQQSGGYATLERQEWEEGGTYYCKITIVSNQAYAGVGKLAASAGWSRAEFRDELALQAVTGDGKVTKSEADTRKYPPAGKDWAWLARKRAKEDAERKLFGKEPSQARQVYGALAAEDRRMAALDVEDAGALLYGQPREALPAPADDPVVNGDYREVDDCESEYHDAEPTDAPRDPEPINPEDYVVSIGEKHVRMGDMSDARLTWFVKHGTERAQGYARAVLDERKENEVKA